MMVITRFCGNAAVLLLCALLLQNCQSNSLRATEEDRLEGDSSSASARRKRASSELPTMQSLTLPSASPAAHVPPSRFSTTLAHKQDLSTSPSILATMANLPTAPHDLPVGAFYAVPLGNKLGALSTDGSRMCVSKVEGVLREMPSEEEDSKPPAERRYLNLAPGDELANKRRAGEEVEPAKAIQFSDVLLVAAQDNNCRQQALEALDRIAQASPDMSSEYLSSLCAAAKGGDKDVRLLALKTLGEVEWKYYFGEVEPAPDLPQDMVTILDSACPFWPGKQVRDTHLLVLIPAKVNGQPFSLNLLRELIQNPKNGEHSTNCHFDDNVKRELTSTTSLLAPPPEASYWLLMTHDVLPRSRGAQYDVQKGLVAQPNKKWLSPQYEVPQVLEAVTVILTHHVRNRERLYGENPSTFIRCEERLLRGRRDFAIIVGGSGSSGFHVKDSGCNIGKYRPGVAGCRRFYAAEGPKPRKEVNDTKKRPSQSLSPDSTDVGGLDRLKERSLPETIGGEEDEHTKYLDFLLYGVKYKNICQQNSESPVVAQNDDFRRHSLETLGDALTRTSSDRVPRYLPSLRGIAEDEDESQQVRLKALGILGELAEGLRADIEMFEKCYSSLQIASFGEDEDVRRFAYEILNGIDGLSELLGDE